MAKKKKVRYCSVIKCGFGDVESISVELLVETERIKYANVATQVGVDMSGREIPVCDTCQPMLAHCRLTWRKI